jgi:hypothetical protein
MGCHSWLAIVKRQRVACSPTNFMNLIDTKNNINDKRQQQRGTWKYANLGEYKKLTFK